MHRNFQIETMHKFPSTPHLTNLGFLPIRGDKVFTEKERAEFLAHEVLVEEKIDGANLGICFDDQANVQLQNRGNIVCFPYYGQWKKIPEWLKRHEDRLFSTIGTEYILFGEWCYAKHTIEYTRLPQWFIGFDLYDIRNERYLAPDNRNKLLQQAGIPIIAEIGRGRFTLDQLIMLMKQSAYSDNNCEGLYLRYEKKGWLEQRAKLVRPEFMQSIETHWSKKSLISNRVIDSWT